MLPIFLVHRLSTIYYNRGIYYRLYKQSAIFRICLIFSLIFWNVCYPMIVHGLAMTVAYLSTIFKHSINIFRGTLLENIVKFIIFLGIIVLLSIQFPANYRNFLYFTILITTAFHIGFEYYVYKYGDQVNDMYHVFIFNDDNIEHAGGHVFAEFGVREEPLDETEIVRNDRQNVHDSTVNKTLKQTVETLVENTMIVSSKEETLREIRELVEAERDEIRRKRMNTTLNTIIRDSARIHNINMTMLELLQLVWNRFKDPSLKEHRKTLVGNLLDELVDSTEVTVKPLCSTGIYARIVDSANCIDPLVTIKPKWALRKELLNYANMLYKEMVAELTEAEKEHLNVFEPTEEDNTWIADFRNKYQLRLLNYCKRTYIDTKLLTKKELHKEIDSWIDNIIV